jgi:hypothetical protein
MPVTVLGAMPLVRLMTSAGPEPRVVENRSKREEVNAHDRADPDMPRAAAPIPAKVNSMPTMIP